MLLQVVAYTRFALQVAHCECLFAGISPLDCSKIHKQVCTVRASCLAVLFVRKCHQEYMACFTVPDGNNLLPVVVNDSSGRAKGWTVCSAPQTHPAPLQASIFHRWLSRAIPIPFYRVSAIYPILLIATIGLIEAGFLDYATAPAIERKLDCPVKYPHPPR
ncbi:hypothetical protein VTO42DRAFT_2921 [Malbranchea cinnamomea]